MTEHLTATTILSDFRSGSSLPVLVDTDSGMKCVVKWKGTGEGPLANAVDWICLHLARQSGILVPTPFLIKIGKHLIAKNRDPEINDLVGRSLGLNLGLEYIADALPYKVSLAERCDSAAKDLIYLFDVLVLNIDRTDFNPNMVVSNDKLYCIDFAAAIAVKMLMSGVEHSEKALLPLIRRHPFFKHRADLTVTDFDFDVAESIASMPEEWLGESTATRESISSGLREMLLDSRSILERRLTLLNGLTPESSEEIKARTLENRRAFEKKWGKF